VFGPIKNDMPRTVDLASETVALLREHKRHQAELKMKNRTIYQDHGLVFAKEWGERYGRQDFLGLPLQANNIGEREFARIIKAAKVRRISIHGLRHTSATLLLKAGVVAHVVQQRLGHKRIEMTLGIYAHALPSMQQDAARRLGALLHG
jgi:integrase